MVLNLVELDLLFWCNEGTGTVLILTIVPNLVLLVQLQYCG